MSGEEWRRGVHAELDGYFAARRGGTLPQARAIPEEKDAGKVNALAASPTARYATGPRSETPPPARGDASTAERSDV